jgi:isopropylmalate/homocitrate/citramalate synthase
MSDAAPTIERFDTTLRDGTQGEHVTLLARDKERIARQWSTDGVSANVVDASWQAPADGVRDGLLHTDSDAAAA